MSGGVHFEQCMSHHPVLLSWPKLFCSKGRSLQNCAEKGRNISFVSWPRAQVIDVAYAMIVNILTRVSPYPLTVLMHYEQKVILRQYHLSMEKYNAHTNISERYILCSTRYPLYYTIGRSVQDEKFVSQL